MQTFVLDACAFIAYLRREEGYESVERILKEAKNSINRTLMHSATLAEVYYDFWRAAEKDTADEVLIDFADLPIQLIETVFPEMIELIGYYKVNYKLSFADTFVLATAKLNNAKVVSSDHHEFDAVEQKGDVAFEWIR